MRITFVLMRTEADGGMSLAVRRLALALAEQGANCELLMPHSGAAFDTAAVPVRTSSALPCHTEGRGIDQVVLRRDLARSLPDLVIVCEGDADLVAAAGDVSPTLLRTGVTWPACPDATRYWQRLGCQCHARAGWKCLGLRPLLACSGSKNVLSAARIRGYRRLRGVMDDKGVGVVSISGPQAGVLQDSGVRAETICVVPNLGLRLSEEELARCAWAIRPTDRSSIVFLGRLSKEKGAEYLPEIARAAPDLRVFGDGYLVQSLESTLGTSLRGSVGQHEVAGLLQWARGVVFPSTWPEPGGIVGIDAQLFGAPLAAFAVGAPMDWPGAELFTPKDAAAMGAWAARCAAVTEARSPEAIAARQRVYWEAVGRRASSLFDDFVATGRFPALDTNAVTADLTTALAAAPTSTMVGIPTRTPHPPGRAR